MPAGLARPSTRSKLVAAFAALVFAAFLIDWIDMRSPAIADLRQRKLDMARLSAPDIDEALRASYVAQQEPLRLTGKFVAARLAFNVDDPAKANLSLFIRRIRDNYAVYINGKLASPLVGVLSPDPTLEGAQPRLTKLLQSHFVKGTNVIHILCARNDTSPFLREVYFGPTDRLEPAFHHSIFVMRDVAEFAVLASAMVILFALALSSIIRNPALVLTIATTLSFFILREVHTLWLGVAWSQSLRDAYFLISAAAVWTSCAALVNEWTIGPPRYRYAFLWLGLCVSALIALTFAIFPISIASATAAVMETLTEFITFAFMAYRLYRFYAEADASAVVEIFAAVVCLMMAIASIVTQTGIAPAVADMVAVQGNAFVQFGALSIIAFIASGLARQGVAVYQMAALNNETLARKVEDREREIERQHAALRAQEGERVLAAERGRIMSDVHDGIGSQLLGLLIQAKASQTTPEKLVDGLQAALDDLYLVVDSLDTVEGSLETALGTFRTRIEPKCQAAGVSLSWDMDAASGARVASPTAILQICRILQEAVSNAIRHGRATQLALKLKADDHVTTLSLSDNGIGFNPANVTGKGRGLANMRKRAHSIGATFEMTGSNSGTTITLTVPAQARQQRAP